MTPFFIGLIYSVNGGNAIGKKYINRLFDKTLDFALRSKGAVLVEGPKWCGKSTTCKRYRRSYAFMK